MDETTGRNLGNESLEENLWILGVPKIRAGTKPEGYNLLYSFLLKKFFVLTYVFNNRAMNLFEGREDLGYSNFMWFVCKV